MAHHAGDEEPLSPHIRNEVSILGEASESEVSTFANQVAGHGTMLTSRDGTHLVSFQLNFPTTLQLHTPCNMSFPG